MANKNHRPGPKLVRIKGCWGDISYNVLLDGIVIGKMAGRGKAWRIWIKQYGGENFLGTSSDSGSAKDAIVRAYRPESR